MPNNLDHVHFMNNKLIDIIYPVGSVICLAAGTDPADIFDYNTTWSKITSNYSIQISDQAQIGSGATSYSFTPAGTFTAVALTSDQSPILQCGAATSTTASNVYRTDVNYSYTTVSGQSTYAFADDETGGAHGHNAHGTAYATSYTWYFDNVAGSLTPTAGAWVNSVKTYTSGSTYYTCTVPTSNHGLATINQTLALSTAHTHSMTVGANSAATSTHNHTITHGKVTFNLTAHPKLNMTVWQRIA